MAEHKRLEYAEEVKEIFDYEVVQGATDLFDAFDSAIENATTVDAVEVVRCKDCRWARPKDHREPTDTPRELVCQCFKHHHIPAPWYARLAVDPDDFCSYGERRTDNEIDKSG